MPRDSDPTADRKAWLGLLAKARPDSLARHWTALGMAPDHAVLRAPEIGGVMVRGRTGATGAPFNLGEMTVTRCSVRLDSGEVGHAYVQGRDKAQARRAALVDALMQTDAAPAIEAALLGPLRQEAEARRTDRAARRRRRRSISSPWSGERIDGHADPDRRLQPTPRSSPRGPSAPS